MALKATIYKFSLQVSDLNRQYYQTHALTVARHPSETDERTMVRVLAFALHAHEHLTFTRGLSSEDEPDLWQKDLTGAIESWIEIGQPDEKRARKACGRSKQVFVYTYSGNGAEMWWKQVSEKLRETRNLTVINLPTEQSRQLAQLANKSLPLQVTIQEHEVWIGNADQTIHIELTVRHQPS